MRAKNGLMRFMKKQKKSEIKRVDALLSNLGYCSRSEVAWFLQNNEVALDGNRIFEPSQKVRHEQITINLKPLDPQKLLILMNKPSNYICSHDDTGVLIYSLLPKIWQNRNPKISTIGRLDIDTTGAILLTDDGALNHKFANPKKKIPKVYEATLAQDLKGDEIAIFESGELMLKNDNKPLQSAKLEILSPRLARIEIFEGRYHQVKRMFVAVGNKVVKLHRVSFAGFCIDDLNLGEFKLIEI